MKDLKQFIGIYPVSKTLRFELRPIGKTQEWIEKNRVLENDESKAADYPVVKKLIDEYHKVCIRESMKNVHLDWNPLKEAIENYQKTKSEEAKKRLEAEQAMMRKQIATAIKDFKHYKELTAATPSDLITSVLPEFSDNNLQDWFDWRHRIVHRNGREKDGTYHQFCLDDVKKALANIDAAINHFMTIISKQQ